MNTTASAVTTETTATSSVPEIASMLVVLQASLSLVSGLSAIPFAIVEPGFRVLSLVTIAIAIGMFWLARNLRRQRRWARRWVIALELLSLVPTLLLMLLPIGAVRGPVPVLVNLVLPAAVLWLLWSRPGRAAFGRRPAGETGSAAKRGAA
jgi:hypothetical protein